MMGCHPGNCNSADRASILPGQALWNRHFRWSRLQRRAALSLFPSLHRSSLDDPLRQRCAVETHSRMDLLQFLEGSSGLLLVSRWGIFGRAKLLLSRREDHVFYGLRLGGSLALPCYVSIMKAKALEGSPIKVDK